MLRHLIESNLALLAQGRDLLSTLDDRAYSSPIGAQMRHTLEFYECYLAGIPYNSIDYDARRRDRSIENSRANALNKISQLSLSLAQCPVTDSAIQVRMDEASTTSSIGRELQALVSHTIHHFAIIALTLRMQNVPVHPNLGVATSTLRYQQQQAA